MTGPPDGIDPTDQQTVESKTDTASAGTSATATPVTSLAAPGGVRNDSGATAELTKFLSRTPFLDLHYRAGGDGEDDEHAWRRRLCFVSDYIVRAIAVLLIFAIAAGVAYKTLAPIPAHLW